ncbi:MAG TPA: HD domain-containing protein, partial [Pyrinomonadaceae bacterium]|nr:HD domain-containing protein [Pyrinomonadaceae bacterium]
MTIEDRIPLLEDILDKWKGTIGGDFAGYKNHVYRMTNFCFALGEYNAEEREKIIIAGCFHDIGIWTGATFDYLPPSILSAREYLQRNDLAGWIPEIELMIDQHHKLGAYRDNQLVETFRKGDLVDFSLGVVKCGLPKTYIKSIKKQFPNAGFHKGLVKLAGRWICRHP